MTTLREAAQQALEALETPIHEQSFMQKQNAITNLRAALAEPQPLYGWVFKRNADGTVGIFAPPPKPGESKRTSDCVGTNQRDLNELLGKLADHMAALAEPQEPVPVATMTVREDMGADFKFSRPHTLQPGQQFYLYTAPPQRRPLTEDEIRQVGASYTEEAWIDDGWSIAFARAIERAHGIGGEE